LIGQRWGDVFSLQVDNLRPLLNHLVVVPLLDDATPM
jgi:hypothetical protein